MKNSTTTRRQSWITTYRFLIMLLTVALVAMVGILLARPAPSAAPSAAEIAQAVNGPTKFERPSSMEYVAKTNSCVVGGTVVSTEWHTTDGKSHPVASLDTKSVSYTSFVFKADDGRTFTVSTNDALFTKPGENLGLELRCDQATMNTAPSFGMVAIIWGGNK